MTFVVKCAPILKSWNFCLCSCSMRRASLVLGWHRLICVIALCLLQITWLLKIGNPHVLNKIVSHTSKGIYETIPEELLICSLITTVICALLCCTLLFGIYTNRAAFMVPHLLMELLIITVFTLSAVVLSSLNLAMKNLGLGMAFFLGGFVCIGILGLMWVVLYSYYRHLDELQYQIKCSQDTEISQLVD